MQIIKKIDPIANSFGLSLLAAIMPLLMMADVLGKRWIPASIVVGLIVLAIAWADTPAPGTKFHLKFSGPSLYLFVVASIILILASLFAPI